MDTIRILIADDHPVFRFGLQALLRVEPDIDVVGEATSGDEAVTQAAKLMPDVILMDLNMPGRNGIEATRAIIESNPGTGILIITMFDDDSVFAAMRAGARGYLLKGAEGEETVKAIHSVSRGEAIFSPSIARRVIEYFASPTITPSERFAGLTEREQEILALIAQGLTNSAIAEHFGLSPKTVRNHVSNIFGKLQVADRAEAILRARAAGIGRV